MIISLCCFVPGAFSRAATFVAAARLPATTGDDAAVLVSMLLLLLSCFVCFFGLQSGPASLRSYRNLLSTLCLACVFMLLGSCFAAPLVFAWFPALWFAVVFTLTLAAPFFVFAFMLVGIPTFVMQFGCNIMRELGVPAHITVKTTFIGHVVHIRTAAVEEINIRIFPNFHIEIVCGVPRGSRYSAAVSHIVVDVNVISFIDVFHSHA